MTLCYGRCHGGPFDGRKIAHHEPRHTVAFELFSGKVSVGVLKGTPGYRFGEYSWKDGAWHYSPPDES